MIGPSAAGTAGCLWENADTPSGGVSGPIPDGLTTQNAHGETVILSTQQLQPADAIVAVGKSQNIPARGQLIALTTAFTTSTLCVLSNTSAYPASANIPNDGSGGDHHSVGLFQQRPAAG